MIQVNDLVIKRLSASDGAQLSQLLGDANEDYGKYFTPFSSQKESLEKRLREAVKDSYWGLWFDSELAGFFMLRGFDEGYKKPSFGVFISRKYSNNGLSKMALDFAISWCQLNNLSAIMIKVHRENKYARRSYEKAGFILTGNCPDTGHDIMEIHWD